MPIKLDLRVRFNVLAVKYNRPKEGLRVPDVLNLVNISSQAHLGFLKSSAKENSLVTVLLEGIKGKSVSTEFFVIENFNSELFHAFHFELDFGLSHSVFWDFVRHKPSAVRFLLEYVHVVVTHST